MAKNGKPVVHLTAPEVSRLNDAALWLRTEVEAGRISLKDAIAHVRAAPVTVHQKSKTP